MTPLLVLASWLAVGAALGVAVRGRDRGAARARAAGAGGRGELVSTVGEAHPGWSGAAIAQVIVAAVGLRTRRKPSRRDLILLIDECGSALASGSSPGQAMVAASRLPGPLGSGLARGVGRIRNGSGFQEVLDDWAAEHREVGAMLLADALALADATGGNRSRALAGVRSTLREADDLAGEVRALAVQSRLSASVLTVVPVGFAALVAVADHRIASFLLATPVGWACLIGGGALDGIGAWWMQRLTGTLR